MDLLPDVNCTIEIGELCVFRSSNSCEWRIGKVQKFSKYKCKWLKDQEYKASFAEVKMKDIGVLCIWFVGLNYSCLSMTWILVHKHTMKDQMNKSMFQYLIIFAPSIQSVLMYITHKSNFKFQSVKETPLL